MRPALRWTLLAGVTGLVLGAAAASPRLLRRVDAFRVQRVEVVGTRYLAPHEALARSGITRTANLFDDPRPWRARLLLHPLVEEVAVERRLPGTLTLAVVEVEPVALARTPELRAVDADGRVLPIQLAGIGLDLPVLGVGSAVGSDGRLSDRVARELVRELERLERRDDALAARVSEVQPAPGGVRLLLREPAALEALLPADAERARLRQLRRVLADLAARGELPRVRRVDARFRDQVVVTMDPNDEG